MLKLRYELTRSHEVPRGWKRSTQSPNAESRQKLIQNIFLYEFLPQLPLVQGNGEVQSILSGTGQVGERWDTPSSPRSAVHQTYVYYYHRSRISKEPNNLHLRLSTLNTPHSFHRDTKKNKKKLGW